MCGRWLLIFGVLPGLALAQTPNLPAPDPDVQAHMDSLRKQGEEGYRQAHDVLRKIDDMHGQLEQTYAYANSKLPEYFNAQRLAAQHRRTNPVPGAPQ